MHAAVQYALNTAWLVVGSLTEVGPTLCLIANADFKLENCRRQWSFLLSAFEAFIHIRSRFTIALRNFSKSHGAELAVPIDLYQCDDCRGGPRFPSDA